MKNRTKLILAFIGCILFSTSIFAQSTDTTIHASIANKKGGDITFNELKDNKLTIDKNNYTIVSFKITIAKPKGILEEITITGNELNSNALNILKKLEESLNTITDKTYIPKIYFEDIKVKNEKGTEYMLKALIFKLVANQTK